MESNFLDGLCQLDKNGDSSSSVLQLKKRILHIFKQQFEICQPNQSLKMFKARADFDIIIYKTVNKNKIEIALYFQFHGNAIQIIYQ